MKNMKTGIVVPGLRRHPPHTYVLRSGVTGATHAIGISMGGEKNAPSSMRKERPSEEEHNYIDYFKHTRSTGLLRSLSKRRSAE